jgi:DNA-directed RNA polymerase subunit M/transcription elongation factor TFIIS
VCRQENDGERSTILEGERWWVMDKTDPQREEERLKVGREPSALTEWALRALKSELQKRGLELPEVEERVEDKPVVLRIYRDMPAAYVDQSILDSAGIRCYLQDSNVVRMDWLWSNALGGIKLIVGELDREDAEKLLSEKTRESFTVEGVGEYEQERCPRCGSRDVSCDELKKRIAGAGLLLGIPIAMMQRGWNCHACGHLWEVVEPGSAERHE